MSKHVVFCWLIRARKRQHPQGFGKKEKTGSDLHRLDRQAGRAFRVVRNLQPLKIAGVGGLIGRVELSVAAVVQALEVQMLVIGQLRMDAHHRGYAHIGANCRDPAEFDTEIGKAVRCGAKIIGVNNRNLKTFSVDIGNAERLRDKVPAGCLYVAESGVTGPEDADRMRRLGADAALVGEALMRAGDKAALLAAMRRTE